LGPLIEALAVSVVVALLLLAQYYRYRSVSGSGFDRQGLARAYGRLTLGFAVVAAIMWCVYLLMLNLGR
jgi:hypothetical protein